MEAGSHLKSGSNARTISRLAPAASVDEPPGYLAIRDHKVFDIPRDGGPGGLVWQLRGQRVDALTRIVPGSPVGGR
jgi:hypothetical protein